MELTHLGALKTVLSEVLLLSREQRHFRSDLRAALERPGGLRPACPASAASAAAAAPSATAGSGCGRGPAAAGHGGDEALRAAVDALTCEVACLRAALLDGSTVLSAATWRSVQEPPPGAPAAPVGAGTGVAGAAAKPCTACSAGGGGESGCSDAGWPAGGGSGVNSAAADLPGERLHRLTPTEFASLVLVGRCGRRVDFVPHAPRVIPVRPPPSPPSTVSSCVFIGGIGRGMRGSVGGVATPGGGSGGPGSAVPSPSAEANPPAALWRSESALRRGAPAEDTAALAAGGAYTIRTGGGAERGLTHTSRGSGGGGPGRAGGWIAELAAAVDDDAAGAP